MLHRDISSENLMWDPEEDCGILNDFDLAKLVKEMQCGPSAKHKTGTLPFLALDLLHSWNSQHLFQHDFESFLYVIMWIVARYENGEEKFTEELVLWLCKDPGRVLSSKLLLFSHPFELDKVRWKQSQTYPTIFDTWINPLSDALQDLMERTKRASRKRSTVSKEDVDQFREAFIRTIRG
jgi:serine/threonine protein kinase